MGDRCYMEITCRRQDQERFRALGFEVQSEEANTRCLTMVDAEANYAHSGDLPTDIPYHGFNGPAFEYGSGACACDGQRYSELETGHAGGYVVAWDEKQNRPEPNSLRGIRRFISIHQRAEARMRTSGLKPPKPLTKVGASNEHLNQKPRGPV